MRVQVVLVTPQFGEGRAQRLRRLGEGWGRRVVTETQRHWGPFLNDGGKSRKAFFAEVGPEGEIILGNDARNAQGDLYAQYVHLVGANKADTLLPKVAAFVGAHVGALYLEACTREIARVTGSRTRTFSL